MIKTNIQGKYIHQYEMIVNFVENIYLADYTHRTKNSEIKRSVEFFSPSPPTDIEYFTILNNEKFPVDGIEFDNTSFVWGNGQPKSQCEAVWFPTNSNSNSWVLFCELKYSSRLAYNEINLRKAIKQLCKTRYYYIQNNIINLTNKCYLIASLPLQSEPFANFSITPSLLIKLKKRKNVILRLQNEIEIVDNQNILV